jgi:hypothetical protein
MSGFDVVYADLRERMLRAGVGMQLCKDAPGDLALRASWPHPTKPKELMWFGAIQIKKNYVSYHLLPVYTHPAMLEQVSPALKKRMQGMGCFNFKAVDPALFDELEALTAAGAELYAAPFTLERRSSP